MIELRHLDVCRFVIEECRHLANGCTAKCAYIGLILFRYLSKNDLFRYMHAESVTLWWQVVQPFTRRLHRP